MTNPALRNRYLAESVATASPDTGAGSCLGAGREIGVS